MKVRHKEKIPLESLSEFVDEWSRIDVNVGKFVDEWSKIKVEIR